jgi:hypothetical protein
MRPRVPSLARAALAAVLLAVLVTAAPTASRAAAPGPADACVAGTVWEDRSSGVKYICIYDEIYGGSRWELLESGQRGGDAQPYRSATYGCLGMAAGLSALSGGGADAIVRSYRWPCAHQWDRVAQPAGELRSRVVIQRYGPSGWSTCRDTGYAYNTVAAYGWLAGYDMGSTADCGSGTYRALGFGGFYQGGSWRTGGLTTPSAWLP